MFPSFFDSDADVLRPIFPAAVTNAVRTPAGISFERLSRASGLQMTDRLLVMGILSAEALGALVAMGTSAVTLIRPERPYPSPAQADVVWLLDIDRMDVMTPRLRTGLRCLASGGRLLIELSAAESAAEAGSLSGAPAVSRASERANRRAPSGCRSRARLRTTAAASGGLTYRLPFRGRDACGPSTSS